MLWRERGKVPNDSYCLTQCSNGCSLDSLLFPRQDNHVQRCVRYSALHRWPLLCLFTAVKSEHAMRRTLLRQNVCRCKNRQIFHTVSRISLSNVCTYKFVQDPGVISRIYCTAITKQCSAKKRPKDCHNAQCFSLMEIIILWMGAVRGFGRFRDAVV